MTNDPPSVRRKEGEQKERGSKVKNQSQKDCAAHSSLSVPVLDSATDRADLAVFREIIFKLLGRAKMETRAPANNRNVKVQEKQSTRHLARSCLIIVFICRIHPAGCTVSK